MNEFDELSEGYSLVDPSVDKGPLSYTEGLELERALVPASSIGAPSSVGERPGDIGEVPGSTPGGLIDEPPHFDDDWPEPEPEIPLIADVDTVPPAELRALRPDQVPAIGKHYVIFNGIPRPVVRGNYSVSEDEHVRSNMDPLGALKDSDGGRQARADRTLRMRYRGYLCGELSSL